MTLRNIFNTTVVVNVGEPQEITGEKIFTAPTTFEQPVTITDQTDLDNVATATEWSFSTAGGAVIGKHLTVYDDIRSSQIVEGAQVVSSAGEYHFGTPTSGNTLQLSLSGALSGVKNIYLPVPVTTATIVITEGNQTINGNKTFSGTLAGTGSVTSGGNIIASSGSVTGLSLVALTGRVTLGTGARVMTVTASEPSGSSKSVNVPDPGTTGAEFVLTKSNQTLEGSKTFSSAITANGGVTATGGVSMPNGVLFATTGGTAANLNYYEDSYTGTLIWTWGDATAQTENYTVTRLGKEITMTIPGVNFPASTVAGNPTSAALPTRFRPAAAPLTNSFGVQNLCIPI